MPALDLELLIEGIMLTKVAAVAASKIPMTITISNSEKPACTERRSEDG